MKQRSKRVKALLLVFTTLTIALSGCGNAGDETGGKNSSQITVGIAQDLEDSLDPHKAEAAGTREILFNVFEGLYKPDSDGNLVPAVASGYEVSDDGLVYTFTLRDGVKFHNGNPVTAADVKSSLETCADSSSDRFFNNMDASCTSMDCSINNGALFYFGYAAGNADNNPRFE